MDQLEYAEHARLRRHRRQRAPPERLRHHAFAEHHRRRPGAPHEDVALVVLGNSIALYNPPIRVAEEFAMLDCISGGRLVAGFPVGTSMDTNYCYGQIPALTREKYARGARPDHARLDRARALRVQRPVHQAALRELLAAADAAAASADLHPRRRLGRDLRLLPRQHLLVLVPVVLRLHPRQGADGRLLGPGRRARRARQFAVPRRLRADDLRGRDRRGGRARCTPSTCDYFYNRCLHVYPGLRRRPGYRTIKTIQTGALSQYAPPRAAAMRRSPGRTWSRAGT